MIAIGLLILGAKTLLEPSSRMTLLPRIELRRVAPGLWQRETNLLETEIAWDELVPSWNVQLLPGEMFKIEVAAQVEGRTTKWFNLGSWSIDRNLAPRESQTGQKDADGDVLTDTLALVSPTRQFRLRLTMVGFGNSESRTVELVSLAFQNSKAVPLEPESDRTAWGSVLEPPRRPQSIYPNGNQICSPTALSMVLGYWAEKLGRPELDREVPAVCEGVFDKNWPGTGNWPFNTAFAATVGLRGYVARLENLTQLESFISRGIPVVCSVAYDFLKGKEKRERNDGHLVVLVGFTPEGDPVFNDPGRNVVRMTYRRNDFIRAWNHSGRTTYIVFPRGWRLPVDPLQQWGGP